MMKGGAPAHGRVSTKIKKRNGRLTNLQNPGGVESAVEMVKKGYIGQRKRRGFPSKAPGKVLGEKWFFKWVSADGGNSP